MRFTTALAALFCLSTLVFATTNSTYAFDSAGTSNPPNIVLIFADDLGYGDLGCYGEKRWNTPNIDSIAKQGVRFTDFHSSQPVCSASRASLLTGCYANRIGIHGALGPSAKNGIHDDEVLLSEMLKTQGYKTCAVGKWHLGHHQKFLPLQHGFDRYLGLPYSNDMWPHGPVVKAGTFPELPLIRGNEIIDTDVDANDQKRLTQQYSDFAMEFLQDSKDSPFFLYFAHSFPHVPLYAGDDFQGKSKGGIYGDVLEEFDAVVGRILTFLAQNQLQENTLVLFTSDNGPWLTYGQHAGTAGPLREGKGTVYEGGTRVPLVAMWPGHIPAGSIQDQTAMTIDILPTIARITQSPLPSQPIDGLDILDLFTCKPDAKCPHDAFYHYFRQGELQAIRSGPWKLMLPHDVYCIVPDQPGADGKPGKSQIRKITQPELYHLGNDLGETTNLAKEQPEVLGQLLKKAEQGRQVLGDSLTKTQGSGVRPSGSMK
ncbi:MAG: sulfatase [Planctomycetota bacterium]|jgi:arylsulfatase A